ncbi:MAG: hypothetical protein BWX70_03550 [Verrucomicrobia bacterium ADurb.Bin070]|nr:MAG: hypothetical protein BWX70_03550 [Verrucomicrobia bacterium ADurb.Bin070]
MHRPVRARVGHVHEKRFVRMPRAMLVNKARRLIADRVGVVVGRRPVLGVGERRDGRVVARQRRRIVKTAGPMDRPVKPVETALQRPVVLRVIGLRETRDMPLAHRIGAVAGRTQHFGEGRAAPVQVAPIALRAAVVHHVADPGLMRIKSGQQRGARRTAPSRIVKLREADAVRRQRVEVRRADLAAVTPDVGKPHIIRKDHDDVGLRRRLCRAAPR